MRIAVGLIWNDGQLLVGKRPPSVALAGFEEFPGGKCRPDEDPRDAVVRECLEETGLRVIVGELRLQTDHEYPHGRLSLHFFDCVLAEDQIKASPLPPFRWVAIEQLADLHFPPANVEVLRSILA